MSTANIIMIKLTHRRICINMATGQVILFCHSWILQLGEFKRRLLLLLLLIMVSVRSLPDYELILGFGEISARRLISMALDLVPRWSVLATLHNLTNTCSWLIVFQQSSCVGRRTWLPRTVLELLSNFYDHWFYCSWWVLIINRISHDSAEQVTLSPWNSALLLSLKYMMSLVKVRPPDITNIIVIHFLVDLNSRIMTEGTHGAFEIQRNFFDLWCSPRVISCLRTRVCDTFINIVTLNI